MYEYFKMWEATTTFLHFLKIIHQWLRSDIKNSKITIIHNLNIKNELCLLGFCCWLFLANRTVVSSKTYAYQKPIIEERITNLLYWCTSQKLIYFTIITPQGTRTLYTIHYQNTKHHVGGGKCMEKNIFDMRFWFWNCLKCF